MKVTWSPIAEDLAADAFTFIAAERRGAALEWFDRIAAEGISEDGLQRAKNLNRKRFLESIRTNLRLANQLARYQLYYGDAALLLGELDLFDAVTAEDVRRAAAAWLRRDNRAVLDVLPPPPEPDKKVRSTTPSVPPLFTPRGAERARRESMPPIPPPGTAGQEPAEAEAEEPVPTPVVEVRGKRRGNAPLSASENERARGLVNLDEKFVVDPASMSPKAASYFRHRPFLTPEACRKWRTGYLPRDAGGDRTGGGCTDLGQIPIVQQYPLQESRLGTDHQHLTEELAVGQGTHIAAAFQAPLADGEGLDVVLIGKVLAAARGFDILFREGRVDVADEDVVGG